MSRRLGEIIEQTACLSANPRAEGSGVGKIAAADATKLGEIAILLFSLQLLNLGNGTSLAGRTIAIDDGIILAPNPYRVPRTSAVSAAIPDGIDVSAMLAALDEKQMKHLGLVKAVTLVTKAEQQPEAARQAAQLHLDEFVAALAAPQ